MEHEDAKNENDAKVQQEADILAATHRIFGNAEHGLTVPEIAEMLNLQTTSVKSYLTISKRRVDLYRRLFEQDEDIKERAIGILESRRAVS